MKFDNISSEISNGKLSFQKNNGFGIKDEIIKIGILILRKKNIRF